MREIMTGQERVLAVLRRSEPDCVPTFEWDIDIGLIAKMTGGSYEDFVEGLDLDAIMCSPNYGETPAGTGLILDEWGITRRKGHEDYAMPVDEFSPIKDWADLEALESTRSSCPRPVRYAETQDRPVQRSQSHLYSRA